MKKNKKLIAIISCMILLIGAVGATIAWLTDETDEVVNTFTTSDINITLTENTGENYKMVPGYDISKDPMTKVVAGSEECFLFVKLEKSSNFDNYLTYAIADGWTQLIADKDGNLITDLIYYRTVKTADMGSEYSILNGNKVTVKDTVTKEMMEALNEVGATKPTLSFKAYASQLHKNNDSDFTPAEAWANVPK